MRGVSRTNDVLPSSTMLCSIFTWSQSRAQLSSSPSIHAFGIKPTPSFALPPLPILAHVTKKARFQTWVRKKPAVGQLNTRVRGRKADRFQDISACYATHTTKKKTKSMDIGAVGGRPKALFSFTWLSPPTAPAERFAHFFPSCGEEKLCSAIFSRGQFGISSSNADV